jgi:hypothetical protein
LIKKNKYFNLENYFLTRDSYSSAISFTTDPTVYLCGPIWPTGVTSAAVPVSQHCSNLANSSGHI